MVGNKRLLTQSFFFPYFPLNYVRSATGPCQSLHAPRPFCLLLDAFGVLIQRLRTPYKDMLNPATFDKLRDSKHSKFFTVEDIHW